MKSRVFYFLLTFFVLLVSSSFAKELNCIWDIPIGIEIEDAKMVFEENTGCSLKESNESKNFTKSYVSIDTPINSTTFNITLTGKQTSISDPLIFDSLTIEKLLLAENSVELKDSLDVYAMLYEMLCSKFGSETNRGIQVKGDKILPVIYDFSESILDDHLFNTVDTFISDFGDFTICFEWYNIELCYYHSTTGLVHIAIHQYSTEKSRFSFFENLGEYEAQSHGITSF